MARAGVEQWSAALYRLRQARDEGGRIPALVRQAADGLGVTERTVWRRLAATEPAVPAGFRLSQTDRDAYVDFRGNVVAQ